MSDRALALIDNTPEPAEQPSRRPLDRDQDLLGRRSRDPSSRLSTPIRRYLDDLFTDVQKGFEDQQDRSDDIADYWDCYNCVPNGNRYYNGVAEIYFPIIHDAVEARVTRFVNQAFPQAGRYVEATTMDGSTHAAIVAILDHYIRERRMKTQIAAPLVRNGDIEGQYNLYMDWGEVERVIVSRETRAPRDPVTGVEGPGQQFEDVTEDAERIGMPIFEVLHDCDVLVLPATSDSIEEALAGGGSVVIVRRWSKPKLKRLIAAGTIRADEGKDLIDSMAKFVEQKDIERRLLEAVGIRKGGKEASVWEVWHMLPLDETGRFDEDGTPRLCRVFMGPNRAQLGAKRNPYWNDLCPLLSAPVKKMAGVFKGPSLISYVDKLQYEANDAINEGADAATFSAAPIIRRDSEKSNGPLVYNVGAVWDAPQGALEMMTFPDLTPRAQVRVQMALSAIFQTLGVNPSMLPQQTRTSRPNQAMIAQEQQVDLLTTAEAVTVLEEGILTPAMSWSVDLDYQFRDHQMMVRAYGEMGREAIMQEIAPLQSRAGLTFIWRGGDQVRQNAMLMQAGTAFLNVIQQPAIVQSLAAGGYKIDLAPLLITQTNALFGPVIAGKTIIDQRAELSIGQDQENEMLAQGFVVPVHPLDQDEEHIPRTQRFIQETGDPHGVGWQHLAAHLAQRAQKAEAAMRRQVAQQMAQQDIGPPQQGMGGPAAPQPGAQPVGPRTLKQAPGAIHADQMPRAGAVPMPRRF